MLNNGLKWESLIPEDWKLRPIKSLARKGINSFIDGDWIESPYITNDGLRLIQTGNIGIGKYKEQGYRYITEETFSLLNCTEVFPEDVLICRLADPVGRACLAPKLGNRMITSVDVCILKPKDEYDSRYIVYYLSSSFYLSYMSVISRGSTRDRVSRTQLGNIKISLPPLETQKHIADFLDKETTRIDTLISRKRRQIELLKEKRQAVITQAVTKGLNPSPVSPHPEKGDACVYVLRCADTSFYVGHTDDFPEELRSHQQGKRKQTAACLPVEPVHWEVFGTVEEARERARNLNTSSGHGWQEKEYGEKRVEVKGNNFLSISVPDHWKNIRLKYNDEVMMGQSPSSDDYSLNSEDLPFLQGNADFKDTYPVPKIWCNTANKVCKKDDILLSVRAPIGAINIADQEYGIGRGLCLIRNKKSNRNFLYYLLITANEYLNSIGTGSTYTAITVDDVRNISIPLPPLETQKHIADFLDKAVEKVDKTVEAIQKSINLLQEYRTSLITHAVSGKINNC